MDKVVTGKFAFVILHYLTEEYTESCVSSVQKLFKSGGPKVHIYIVDNASPDGSGQRLYEKYSGNDDVTVILGKEMFYILDHTCRYKVISEDSETIRIATPDPVNTARIIGGRKFLSRYLFPKGIDRKISVTGAEDNGIQPD